MFLRLSVTKNGKAGKSKAIASCRYLEGRFQGYCAEEGGSTETLGTDKRTRTKKLGAKENPRRRRWWWCDEACQRETECLGMAILRVDVRRVSRTGLIPAIVWGGVRPWPSPTARRLTVGGRWRLRRTRITRFPLNLFLAVNRLEVQEEISTVASLFWAEGVRMGKWGKQPQAAWRRQIFEVRR